MTNFYDFVYAQLYRRYKANTLRTLAILMLVSEFLCSWIFANFGDLAKLNTRKIIILSFTKINIRIISTLKQYFYLTLFKSQMWIIFDMKTRSCNLSESETTSGWNWKFIRVGEARAGKKSLSLWSLDSLLALKELE